MAVRFCAGFVGEEKRKRLMSNRKLDLVLKCVVIATGLLKFANELVAFLNTVLNYSPSNAPKVVLKV